MDLAVLESGAREREGTGSKVRPAGMVPPFSAIKNESPPPITRARLGKVVLIVPYSKASRLNLHRSAEMRS